MFGKGSQVWCQCERGAQKKDDARSFAFRACCAVIRRLATCNKIKALAAVPVDGGNFGKG